jgi:hypothetical protein
MSEGGGLVEDVGVPQQGNNEEVEENEDKECHDVRDSEEVEGRHNDRQRRAEQVGCEQCGQWGDFTSGQSEDCPFYLLGYLYLQQNPILLAPATYIHICGLQTLTAGLIDKLK